MNRVAIDCGTNSTRLLIVDDRGHEIERGLRTTRLGEGVDGTGVLSGQAIDRTIMALREFKHSADVHGPSEIVAVATSAVRDARNGTEFLDVAEAVLGSRPHLLSGVEEAELTYVGAVSDRVLASYFVVDIGGGSTELVLGREKAIASASVDIGCVRLTERALHTDPYTLDEIRDARRIAEQSIASASSHLDVELSTSRMVGVGGTVTSLAAIDLGLTAYDPASTHGHVLSIEVLERLCEGLSRDACAERSRRPGMPPNRAEVIVAGSIVLICAMYRFGLDSCVVSEADILDGLARADLSMFSGGPTMVRNDQGTLLRTRDS